MAQGDLETSQHTDIVTLPTPQDQRPALQQKKIAQRLPSHDVIRGRKPRAKRLRVRAEPANTVDDLIRLEVSRSPISSGDLLASHVIHALEEVRLHESWPGLLPSRIGHDASIDVAAKALVRANEYALSGYSSSLNGCLRPYSEAIASLRRALDQPVKASMDATVVTVAILGLVERFLAPASVELGSHMQGLNVLLSSRPPTEPESESDIFRAIVYDTWSSSFIRPAVMGTASIYDRPEWHHLEPAAVYCLPEGTARLRALSNELFIRLPRLIALVRECRSHTRCDAVEDAASLATRLRGLEAAKWETDVLRSMKIEKTAHPRDQAIIAVCFRFVNIAQYEAAMYYWQTRLLLLRLCRRISLSSEGSPNLLQPVEDAEVRRICANIFMAWPYTLSVGITGVTAMSMALVVAWGAVSDFPDLFSPKHRKDKVPNWILGNMNLMVRGWATVGIVEMNDMADLYIGGPIKGKIADHMRAMFGS